MSTTVAKIKTEEVFYHSSGSPFRTACFIIKNSIIFRLDADELSGSHFQSFKFLKPPYEKLFYMPSAFFFVD